MPYAGNPAWPPNFQTGVIFGKFVGSDGVPIVGDISFTPRPTAMIVPADAWTVVPRASVATLDNAGAFTIELPATNDPDVRPMKFTYQVEEQWPGGRVYDISVPRGLTSNIFDLAPVQDSVGVMRYLGPTGPPGPSNVLTMTDNGDGTETISVSAGVLPGLSVSDNGTGSATIGP